MPQWRYVADLVITFYRLVDATPAVPLKIVVGSFVVSILYNVDSDNTIEHGGRMFLVSALSI